MRDFTALPSFNAVNLYNKGTICHISHVSSGQLLDEMDHTVIGIEEFHYVNFNYPCT